MRELQVFVVPFGRDQSGFVDLGRLVETVHVQLSYKTVQIVVLEVHRQYVAAEIVRVRNVEAAAVRIPGDDCLVSGFLQNIP